MTRYMLISTSLVLAMSLAACKPAETPADGNGAAAAKTTVDDAAAVKKAFADFNVAIAAKDLPAIKAQYASDAVMVLPGQAPFQGIDAIMGDYQTYATDPAGKYVSKEESTEVSSGGDMAHGQVNYQSTYTNPTTKAVEVSDRYNLVIYRKQADGSWKVTHDVNAPLPKAS